MSLHHRLPAGSFARTLGVRLGRVVVMTLALCSVLQTRGAFGAPVTNPNDPRSWQGASLETFRSLLGYPTRQALIDAGLLDDGVFPPTADYAASFVRPNAPCGAKPPNIAAPTYVGGVQGCSGYSYNTAGYDYSCGDASLQDFAKRGECLDMWWIQDGGDGDVTSGNVWDLGGQSNQVAVFPIIDHGPLPGEAIEYTVYLSNNPGATSIGTNGETQWVRAFLVKVYLEGWHPGWIADGFTTVWQLPSGQTFRYANVVAGGPGALVRDGDDEIDTVIGMTIGGEPVCSRPECNSSVPTILSLPPLTGAPGVAYAYDVNAVEPGNPTLTYQLIEKPFGMSISSVSGLVTWTPADSQVRAHPVEVEARDARGGAARQRFYVDVRTVAASRDTIPPVVTLRVVQGNLELLGDEVALPVGQSVQLRVEASDNVEVTQRILLKDGLPLALDDVGRTTVTLTAVGRFTLLASARDLAGNTASATRYLRGYDPNDDHLPTVVLHAPTMDTTITAPINVVATVTDPVLESYTVDFARADLVDLDNLHLSDPDWVHLGGGTSSVTDAVVGRFDPTILTNDSYVIRVVGQNVNGRIQTRGVIVNVSGDLKLGEFRIAFTDLTIPVTGVPITVTRVYDSRQSRESRDFGYGWSLGLQDARILEVKRNALGYQSLYPGSRVYINTPDGRRVGFTAYSASINCFGFCFATVGLRPDPGVYEKLDIADDKVAVFYQGNYLGGLASGPFDPERYNLTLKDGTVYEYSQAQGLLRVRDLNGNRLEVTTAGVFHYPAGSNTSDRKIDYIRDAQGRITRIIDPDGHALVYGYDAAGDLRTFQDQVNNTSSYAYHAARPHYLQTITDPLGHQAVRTEYDAAGRVVSITDALGNPVTETFDVDARTGTFTDANGNVTRSLYDDRGNVVRKTDPEGGVTEYEFDANNNETLMRDPLGRVTRKEYDGRGNVTRVVDALGNATVTAYNALNKPTSVTDVLGHTNQFSYDAQGQLLELRNAVNDVSTFTRDSRGRVTSVTDFGGHTTSYDYTGACPCGAPSKVTNPDGTFRLYEYNGLGQVTQETDELGRVTVSTYDPQGKLLSVRDPDGHVTVSTYNSALKVSETDPLGRVTHLAYDAANHQTAITDNAGGVTRFEYDAAGNKTALVDPVGNRTEFVYDGNNRLIRQIDPLGKATRSTYDAAGNLARILDRNGRTREFQYDALNRRTREQWLDSTGVVRTMNFTFNALGLMTGASDPASTLTFNFDVLNRLQSSTQSNVPGLADFTLNYTYDDMGNVTSVTDNYGVQVGSTYDARNRLQARSWQGGGIAGALVRFGYDAAGNKTTVQRYSDLAGTQLVGQSAYTFNAEHAITHIRHANAGGAPLLEFEYTRDAAQQITRRLLDTQTTDYTYDATGQLTGANYSDSQPDESFSYDLNGNRTMPGYATGPGDRLLSDDKHTYAYDLEGNLVLRTELVSGASTAFEYDHMNHLTHATSRNLPGVVTQAVSMTYDGLGRRIAKTVGGVVERYIYDGEAPWMDVDGAGQSGCQYLLGDGVDEFIARRKAFGGVQWYVCDNLSSVVAIAESAGTLSSTTAYTAFGQPLEKGGSSLDGRVAFAGREWDGELAMYHNRARVFMPEAARFASNDPQGLDGGDANLYRYAGNSPLSARDPYGEMALGEGSLLARMQQLATAPLIVTRSALMGLSETPLGLSLFSLFQTVGATVAKFGPGARTFFGSGAVKIGAKVVDGMRYATYNTELAGGLPAAARLATSIAGRYVPPAVPVDVGRFVILLRWSTSGPPTLVVVDKVQQVTEVIRFVLTTH